MRTVIMLSVALLLVQCDGENETTDTAECSAAVNAFTSTIQPSIKKDSCDQSGCHSSASEKSGFALKAGDAQAASNRKNMLHEVKEHDKLDADKLWTFLSGEHTGKGQLGGLTKEKITAWVKAEQGCK